MNKKAKWLIAIFAVLLVAMGVVLYFLFHRMRTTEQEMSEMVEQLTYEKEQLEEEYAEVALEMEGISYKTSNDSLLRLVDKEQQRVQQLLEELKTVKATNARRIAELKKELASVRSVLVYYVAQVDSLNTVNIKLKDENKLVKRQYEAVSQEVTKLSEERTQMQETITKASLLNANNILVETLNERDRKVTRINKIARFKISFSIAKNITAATGEKKVFVRIVTPDDYVLAKQAGKNFAYEGKEIPYSCSKTIEYDGENCDVFLYCNVQEVLNAGDYRIEIFVDNQLIGEHQIKLGK